MSAPAGGLRRLACGDDRLQAAVTKALANGARTRDLGGSLPTDQMGDAVLAALKSRRYAIVEPSLSLPRRALQTPASS